MKYRSEKLRDALAAEYVVGTLSGRARRRFEHALRSDPGLRQHVNGWQERLAPLDEAAPAAQPPARVWQAIERRIAPQSRTVRRNPWSSLAFWRTAGVGGLVATLLLATLLLTRTSEPQTMVVVMADQQDNPAMTVSWDRQTSAGRRLRIRVIGHATMSPDTAWELWMLPEGGANPVSLGLISTHATQFVDVPPQLAALVDRAKGLAMSVEPRGGSPTGAPTGPVLYKGQRVQL